MRTRRLWWLIYTHTVLYTLLALPVIESEAGPTNPYTFSGTVTGEEYAALRLGEFAAASFHTAQQLNDQGVSSKAEGRFSEADAILSKAVEIKERLLGPSHPLLAVTLTNLAEVYLQWGGLLGTEGRDMLDNGRALAQRAIDIRQLTSDPKISEAQRLLAELNTALTAITPPAQNEGVLAAPSEADLLRALPPEIKLLQDGSRAQGSLNKKKRWDHFALRLEEQWLHVEAAADPGTQDPPQVFGIQAVRLVSVISEEPKLSLYVRHIKSNCWHRAKSSSKGVAPAPPTSPIPLFPVPGWSVWMLVC
ncbi:hypothetical protein CYMTET_32684 [Cymbomonas tetramitiformis]|uniref:Tetratricopeptide repeat protein n=1 Tax=Cymbomonas tetramitiformis TaxID=36881 RepID=A0AAE0FEI8_9CHLO|nr:hypothetical protein CYMTET_32684 [Cymbomonas tetramitiformis]